MVGGGLSFTRIRRAYEVWLSFFRETLLTTIGGAFEFQPLVFHVGGIGVFDGTAREFPV